LTVFCAIVGLLAYRRCGGFYRALAAGFAAAGVAGGFALDRPFLITFLLLAIVLVILDSGRRLWLLPPILLIWANCHGGFFLGWIVLGAYSAEAVLLRRPARMLWLMSALALAVSGLNPNGYRIPWILLAYRNSYQTSRLLEWSPPVLWPLHWYSVLLFGAAATLLWVRRRVRPVD